MTDTIISGSSLEIFFALSCIAFNAFFVTAEFALVKVRASRIQELAEAGNRRAQLVLKMLEDIEGYLAATQFGITVVSLGLGWIGEPAIAHLVSNFIPESYLSEPIVAHTIAVVVSFSLIIFFQI